MFSFLKIILIEIELMCGLCKNQMLKTVTREHVYTIWLIMRRGLKYENVYEKREW